MSVYRRAKDPQALLDYGFDWSTWLGTDTIASSTWVVSGEDALLSVESSSHSSSGTTVWLSGGTLGVSYAVTNHIVTADGREDDRTMEINIADK